MKERHQAAFPVLSSVLSSVSFSFDKKGPAAVRRPHAARLRDRRVAAHAAAPFIRTSARMLQLHFFQQFTSVAALAQPALRVGSVCLEVISNGIVSFDGSVDGKSSFISNGRRLVTTGTASHRFS